MPSPYIKLTERDDSAFAVTTSNTIAALVGFASKGPIDTPVLITSKKQFNDTFGLTPKAQPFSHLAAYKYLEQGNALWFTRIASTEASASYTRVLSNDGTGVAAKLTSTNSINDASLTAGADYGIKITSQVADVDYEDTIIVNLTSATNDTGLIELVSKINIAIANSVSLAGKVVASRTKSNGEVSETSSLNLYLTLATINTGSDDSIKVDNPDSVDSLLYNGIFGFSYQQNQAFGDYSAPSKASVTGNVVIESSSVTSHDLSTDGGNGLYNLSLLVDNDVAVTTIDLASRNKAFAYSDVVYSTSVSNGFNTLKNKIKITMDDFVATSIDLTRNDGIDATRGYQAWKFENSVMTATSDSGLNTFGSSWIEIDEVVDGDSTTGLAASDYDFNVSVDSDVDKITITAGANPTYSTLLSLISDELDLAAHVGSGNYSLSLIEVGSKTRLTITGDGDLAGKNIKITAVDPATGGGVLDLLDSLGYTVPATPDNFEVCQYKIIASVNGGVATDIIVKADSSVVGQEDISTISGFISAFNIIAVDLSLAMESSFVSANSIDPSTTVSGGNYGCLVFFTDARGTEPGSQASISLTYVNNPSPVTTFKGLGVELSNIKSTFETAVLGKDVVLTQGQVLAAINEALGVKGTSSFVDSKLKVTTATYGRDGSVTIEAGDTDNAYAFFGSQTFTGLGGEVTTADEIVEAINVTMNNSRGTTDVTYAIKYFSEYDGKYYLKLQSQVSGLSDARIFVNSINGTTELAPSNNARTAVFISPSAWAVGTDVDIGGEGSINSMFKFVFKEKGTASNYVSPKGCYVQFSTRNNPIYTGANDTTNVKYYKDIYVYFDNVNVEKFEDISYNPADDNWFIDIINADEANGGSSYVNVEWYQADTDSTLDEDVPFVSNPTTGTYLIPNSSAYLADGNDGIPNSGIEVLVQKGIQKYSNAEIYDPHVIATPGISSISVINSVKNFIEGQNRQDILYLVDPPFGLEPQEVADWHNGKSTLANAPTSAINSSYLALYWAWLKNFDEDNGEYVWCPPSVNMIGKLTEIDNNYGAWSIPAGNTRGRITADDYEYSPEQSERDLIYDINGPLNVNPFVDMPGVGLVVYGQKTLLRDDTALNRLNVRRMMIYVKKLVRRALNDFIYEENTPSTWSRIVNSISNIIEPVKQAGGVNDYEVIFDETTTTASLQDQSIASGIVRIVPVKGIEAIELTFGITAQGVTLG